MVSGQEGQGVPEQRRAPQDVPSLDLLRPQIFCLHKGIDQCRAQLQAEAMERLELGSPPGWKEMPFVFVPPSNYIKSVKFQGIQPEI